MIPSEKTVVLIFISFLFALVSISVSAAEVDGLKPKSGVYDEKIQVFPNYFATYCGYNVDELAENEENRNNCINGLGVFLNPSNAQTKAKNVQNYEQNVKTDSIRTLTALAIAKNASIPDLREGVADTATTATQSSTIHDDNKGHVLALSQYKDVLNSLRELMAESNMLSVVSELPNIDRDVAIETARDQSNITDNSLEKASSTNTDSKSANGGNSNNNVAEDGVNAGGNSSSVSSNMKEYTYEKPYLGKWMWVEDNACTRAVCTGVGDTEASLDCVYERKNCPDGAYSTTVANKIVNCEGGKCEVLSTKDEDICGSKSLMSINTLSFSYQSGDQPAVCTNGQKFVLCPDGKYKISGSYYYACQNGKCVECLDK